MRPSIVSLAVALCAAATYGERSVTPEALETLKRCAERLHAAGVEASVSVWSSEASRPETYLALWELGFDSFGTDYPEALYKAVEILRGRATSR